MKPQDHRMAGQPAEHYRSLANFYAADPRRVESRELDVGLWWREDAEGPLHRAAWVSETGELYLVRLGPVEQGGGRVELLATVADRARMERVLEGWRDRCGQPRSLVWLRGRARLAACERTRHSEQRSSSAARSRPARARSLRPLPL